MTNGSHPPKKPLPPTSKKEKRLKARKAKPSDKAHGRLAVLMAGNA
jgi:hypothetical protein